MDENIQDFPESPFEPWRPVSPDKFKGRKKDISKITRYLPKVKNQGTPEHFFITGECSPKLIFDFSSNNFLA